MLPRCGRCWMRAWLRPSSADTGKAPLPEPIALRWSPVACRWRRAAVQRAGGRSHWSGNAKRLRALLEREFKRVGGNRTVKVDDRSPRPQIWMSRRRLRAGGFFGDPCYRRRELLLSRSHYATAVKTPGLPGRASRGACWVRTVLRGYWGPSLRSSRYRMKSDHGEPAPDSLCAARTLNVIATSRKP